MSGACAPARSRLEGAPAPSGAAGQPDPVDIDGLVRLGCQACLERAFTAAERTSPGRAYEIAALLVLRAKELGLPVEPWASRMATVAPVDPAWSAYADMVAAIPPDPRGGDREDLLRQTMPRREAVSRLAEWRASLAAGPASPEFRTYLDLSLACEYATARDWGTTAAAALAQAPDVPLVLYRVGACGAEDDIPRLRALRAAHPEFVDADYALARQALGDREAPDQDDALARLRAAAEAFPQSPAIRASLGLLHEEREEWAEALAAHDAALALVPTHRDALLGRAIALSNLLRREEAIAAAGRLIELGNWFLPQAYYWRAWNQFHLGRHAEARVDADAAKSGTADPAVLVLSGMIEWRARRLEPAEREFRRAVQLDAQQCEARTFLAAVLAERGLPRESLAAFGESRECFDAYLMARRGELSKLEAGPASPEAKARQRTREARAIADAVARRDEAVRNERALRQRLGLAPLEEGLSP